MPLDTSDDEGDEELSSTLKGEGLECLDFLSFLAAKGSEKARMTGGGWALVGGSEKEGAISDSDLLRGGEQSQG